VVIQSKASPLKVCDEYMAAGKWNFFIIIRKEIGTKSEYKQHLFANLTTHHSIFVEGFSRSKELEILDLSANYLNCSIITSLHGFTALRSLNLGYNNFNCSLSALGTHLKTFIYVMNVFIFIFFKRIMSLHQILSNWTG
jgi:hypothetical protein